MAANETRQRGKTLTGTQDPTPGMSGEDAYRSLFESMSEGFVVGSVLYDADGVACDYQFVEVNPAYERLTGLSRDESLRKTILQLIPTLEPQWIANHARVVETGEPLRWESYNAHTGKTYEIYTYRPRPDLFASIFSDITERKRVEQELLARERRQQEVLTALEVEHSRLVTVLENLPVGVWIGDQSGALIGKNEAADRIWMGDAPLLKSIDEYPAYAAWHAETGAKLLPEDYPFAVALRTGQRVDPTELRIRRLDGTVGTILVSAAPIRDSEGQMSGVIGINVDITSRKEAEAALRESEERYRTLFNSIDEGYCIIEMLFDDVDRPIDYRFLEVNSAFER
jgi:PAS domain S-box-containing protein